MSNVLVPITIITGFLGAGKTTLLNNLIIANPDHRIIVIENEFGEVGIDGALLVDLDAQIFELSNGCICCNLNEDLQETMLKLVDLKSRPDHLIIETTGLADPAPVIAALLSDEIIQSNFRIDAVITLVDALHIEQQWQEHPQCFNQISLGNFIIVNKVASVPKNELQVLISKIAALNPEAEVYATNFCEVKDVDLLHLSTFEGKSNAQPPANRKFTFLNNSPYAKKITLDPIAHPEVSSVHVVSHTPLDIIKFDQWLKALMGNHFGNLLRVKGFIFAEDFDFPLIIQGVMNLYVSEQGSAPTAGVPGHSSLVFIGRKLERQLLQEGIDLCIASEVTDIDFKSLYDNIEKIQERFLN
ncbi:MAG TPA: GTP-binding protein [Cytophagales bacterium]|nr:GTP-binding protein [Cytophagales bacterium]